ncbi:hypothetical protein DM860_007278 [Cuscuta australis]|uniref:ER membrane protein complex subunit 1 n=1 Tax=Cuscuta australis TaxID=267555 RepID=A0A328E7F8_9ASTE|nr:hypothetical protein DM860_007278 [Cuscuta australis]
MASRASLLIFLFFFSSAYTVLSLYEDQVGLIDWHQRYIGKVKHAVFHTQKAGRKRVVVSTEENVIASLDLRHGDIFWRHALGHKDVIDGIDITLGKYVITLSSGSTVRAWNLPDGQMVWESFLGGSNPSKSFLVIPSNLKVDWNSLILIYSNGHLHAVSSTDGEVIWAKELVKEGIDIQHIVHPEGTNDVYAVGLTSSSQFEAYKINAINGELLKHESMVFPGGFCGDLSLVTSDRAVGLDSTGSILLSIAFKDGLINFQQVHIADLVQDFTGTAVLLPSKLIGMVTIHINKSILFIRVTHEGKLELVDSVAYGAALSESVSVSEGHQAFGLVQHDDVKINLSVKSVNDWDSNFLEESLKLDSQKGLVHKVFINNYIRTDRSYGFRALIVLEDHSLLLFQQGEVVWSREDGLASIVDVTTSELPFEKNGVSVSKVEQNLFEWLKGHMLKLKRTLMLATPDDMAALQHMRLQSSEKSKMTRDHNGFRKLLIVLSRAGKLYALHTGDGRIVWSYLVNALRKSETCEHPNGFKIYQWQVPHHHAMDENPSVLVVGKCGLNSDAPSVLSFVDANTGKQLSYVRPGHSITHVIPLQYTDSTEQQLHLLIDTDGHGHLYPRTPEALGIFKRELGYIYWYSVEANNILRGRAVMEKYFHGLVDEYHFATRDVWSVVFPPESEHIIATATRKSNEVVHTQAKVTADQDVTYKYISKNMLFVATVSPKAAGGDIGSVIPDESFLVVYLIDTVTGRILHRMLHQGSLGPVNAVLSENWVVYHYFNLRAHRYEMSVIEIYDQSRADNKDLLKLVLRKHNLTKPLSSYSRPEVSTKSQSYFFAHSVKTIAVTATTKGITSKQLLVGTVGDQVLALDKRFLDPRRTVNPTQAEKEEGIIPLTDSLPIIPQSYATHAVKVEGLRGIVTVPAKLESTTLVFAYGVDLFFTRLAPSKTYDSLTEDFSYALLLLTIVALVVAIFITWIWSERKELQEKWR